VKIQELYQEEPGGTITHYDQEYDLNSLFKLTNDLPIINFKIDDLKWILYYFYKDVKHSDLSRIRNADLSAPILIIKDDNKFIILDGIHRLCKAISYGYDELPR